MKKKYLTKTILINIGVTNIGRKPCSNFKIALIFRPDQFGFHYTFNADVNNVHSVSQTILDNKRIKISFGSKETIFPEESIDFSPTIKIPYSYINQFLDASNFEIILWYDGGPRIYRYNLKEEEFSSIEE